MVFMGLFSKFVLGFPLLISSSMPFFHIFPENYRFPDSGNRTSLRFLPIPRGTKKRRCKNGRGYEEELTFYHSEDELLSFDFIGEVIESSRTLKLS